MPNERTPLLGSYAYGDSEDYPSVDPHEQFCMLVGVPSSAPERQGKKQPVPQKSLYGRVTRQLGSQRFTYYATASLSSTMLLTQVVLGAALTALGASESSHILITVFGALNTVIAGLVAYLKSRGQPMRARMYRDDLERVVDEIENSEVMWLGIARHVHGYDEIDTDDRVSVRSEVARLTRLYDRAIRTNTINNPDMYEVAAPGAEGNGTNLRHGASHPIAPVPVPAPAPTAAAGPAVEAGPSTTPAVLAPTPAPAPVVVDPDESPATAPPQPKVEAKKVEEGKGEGEGEAKKKNAGTTTPENDKEPIKDGKQSEPTSESKPSTESTAQLDADPSKPPQPSQKQTDPDVEPASNPPLPLKDASSDGPNGKA
ncbi:hypothetical protein LTS07_005076 [Exophiala sideris]|uniref:SMODS and SLOG-associating 2TM effector domain-containing protein n=1 Tax=Exophiala sideris TaxID=1016849 RepID=A0ABR0JCE9_9EURO|nr:hypothetical protein LTS07_005076 [Exophiala sideris]KAK5039061.1 hypothetical protein LTR13_004092 [Exophiala sideris]KAK5060946.1 hypothetical protein LTR69_005545 [Exophiala sideris]KAK5183857.1 hypothetical protein LTR44_004139 [Eurotiomycetes sp. CCFEE 6388]